MYVYDYMEWLQQEVERLEDENKTLKKIIEDMAKTWNPPPNITVIGDIRSVDTK